MRGDKLEGDEKRKTKFGAIATVSLAFFLAEIGEPTMLDTIALPTKFPTRPIKILIGTATGMLITDGIDIIVGLVLHRKLSERTIKVISSSVFIFLG